MASDQANDLNLCPWYLLETNQFSNSFTGVILRGIKFQRQIDQMVYVCVMYC